MSRIMESFRFYSLWPTFGKWEEQNNSVGKTGKGSLFCGNFVNFSQISENQLFVVVFSYVQIHFYHLIKALNTFTVLPFCLKVEDLSRHPSIFKPHDDLGTKPKGFGKNVKMCVCICLLACVHLCTAHAPVLDCTSNQSLLCAPYFKVQQLLPG